METAETKVHEYFCAELVNTAETLMFNETIEEKDLVPRKPKKRHLGTKIVAAILALVLAFCIFNLG